MLQFNRLALATALAVSSFLAVSESAYAAAPAAGNGSSISVLQCVYSASLPTLTANQTSPVQCDSSGRVINAPFSLLFSAPLQTYGAGGVGADTAFPSSVSTAGTSLGALPTGASRVQLHLPPGANVTLYVAAVVASNATAAALVSETYNNASANTNNMDVSIELNGQQVWVTNVTNGTSGTYISGKPVFRFI